MFQLRFEQIPSKIQVWNTVFNKPRREASIWSACHEYPPSFGTRRFNAVFTRPHRWTVLWARWIQFAFLHSYYCWRRSIWPEKLFILWPAIKTFLYTFLAIDTHKYNASDISSSL